VADGLPGVQLRRGGGRPCLRPRELSGGLVQRRGRAVGLGGRAAARGVRVGQRLASGPRIGLEEVSLVEQVVAVRAGGGQRQRAVHRRDPERDRVHGAGGFLERDPSVGGRRAGLLRRGLGRVARGGRRGLPLVRVVEQR